MFEDIKTISEDIKEIYMILIELEQLETGENADYSDVMTDISYSKMILRNRLIQLREAKQ